MSDIVDNAAVKHVDITPDPQILVALAGTPMNPIDAVCELIDNSIDGLLANSDEKHPLILVTIPTPSEWKAGKRRVGVRDNGSGLTPEMAQDVMKAGFTTNNPYEGKLGMFGLGFNIATSKLGKKTTITTKRSGDAKHTRLTLDIPTILRKKTFQVPYTELDSGDFSHGTVVAVEEPWAKGERDDEFMHKLVVGGPSKPKLMDLLGRRYGTLIKDRGVRLHLNGKEIKAYEHCVWSSKRSVPHKSLGKIPARFDFDEVLKTQRRCTGCWVEIGDASECETCGPGSSIRSISERVRGWIGIQRFDDANLFGIDLFRNGRMIRLGEKEAFFSFKDPNTDLEVKDYPIDGVYGRIIGEVHLDHVPADFTKTNFQRNTEEWDRAMVFLRGASSLQPRQQGDDKNDSIINKLYQGYRKVRQPGLKDMYPARWDSNKKKLVRISRETEKELFTKFSDREPGYFDDTEWWKLVETTEPAPSMWTCEVKSCASQNPDSSPICQICQAPGPDASECISEGCNAKVPRGNTSCEKCGKLQTVQKTWVCVDETCKETNVESDQKCKKCGKSSNYNEFGLNELKDRSSEDIDLSISNCSVTLANGTKSDSVQVCVRLLSTPLDSTSLYSPPVYSVRASGLKAVDIFVDPQHDVFVKYGRSLEMFIAFEVAELIYTGHSKVINSHAHSHTRSNLATAILNEHYQNQMALDTGSDLVSELETLSSLINENLASVLAKENSGRDAYELLSPDDQNLVLDALRRAGCRHTDLPELQKTGGVAHYFGIRAALTLFDECPEWFFDGHVWEEEYHDLVGLPPDQVATIKRRLKDQYAANLKICAIYLEEGVGPGTDHLCPGVRAAKEYLTRMLA